MIKTKSTNLHYWGDIPRPANQESVIAQPSYSFQAVQAIKAQEFERFFNQFLPACIPHLNHLGEVAWLTPEQAEIQHEFFDYHENLWQRLKRKLHRPKNPNLEKLPGRERELRLQFRKYLELTYLGKVLPETARLLPDHWQHPLSVEEIERIPVSLEAYQAMFNLNKKLLIPLFIVLFVGVFGVALAINTNRTATSDILVKSNVSGAAIYLNGEKKGYADFSQTLENLSPGRYRIELRKRGYTSQPVEIELGKMPATSREIFIPMVPIASVSHGFLKIEADHPDSKVFVNDEFLGILESLPILQLDKGDHVIAVEKKGFRANPSKQWVSISVGDTSVVRFNQTPAYVAGGISRSSHPAPGINQGLISVTANVPGARIFLNGEDTGKESDYVFTGLPEGEYKIALHKEGYRAEPSFRVVTLGASDPRMDLSFKLIKEFTRVRIQTDPQSAKIFVDKSYAGKGFFEGELKQGAHEIAFEEISGFKTPPARVIQLKPDTPLELFVKYFPQMNLGATVTATGNINAFYCDLITGYTLNNRGFAASSEGGPEVVFHEQLKQYVWKFGFAFPYRNPRGNDAVKLIFRLPLDYQNDQVFYLEIQGAASEERYPQTLAKKSELKLKINNHQLNLNAPHKTLETLNGLETLKWEISKYLNPGLNTVELATTENNTTYYFVKSIRISN